jgi:hypothetical protein
VAHVCRGEAALGFDGGEVLQVVEDPDGQKLPCAKRHDDKSLAVAQIGPH